MKVVLKSMCLEEFLFDLVLERNLPENLWLHLSFQIPFKLCFKSGLLLLRRCLAEILVLNVVLQSFNFP